MIDWLLETLLWTAGLIALVLVFRQPVARIFGPQLAYALWALPVIRLFLPPITLPAWMAPASEAVAVEVDSAVAAEIPVSFVMPVDPVEPTATSLIANLPLVEISIALWLTGAVYFLYTRFSGYAQMREDMLFECKTVGQSDDIRLIETPATDSPLAFGVTDKVVALPVGFMAQTDLAARDLALEHELAHHSGRDLLVNFLVQPLFALHWFNPLGHLGWLALRRDQEAACDARVMQAREPEERATYANVIASFAAGPNVALAAPMACPVLGDKSIIHRLRSLKMSDLSSRRRLMGRGMVVAALVALPMTASISYAEPAVPVPPEAPAAPLAAIAPAAPDAPLAPLAPTAPLPPAAPLAPPAPLAPLKWQANLELGKHSPLKTATFAFHDPDAADDDEHISKTKKKVKREVHRERIVINGEERAMTKEEREELRRELKEGFAEMDVELKEAMKEYRSAMLELRENGALTRINVECGDGDKRQEFTSKDGNKHMLMCDSEIHASAIKGLKQARAEIAKQDDLSADMRQEILSSLDAKIAEWKSKGD